MKLLILGGTVFLGRHLVDSALARGHEVTMFNRGRHNSELFREVEWLQGDRRYDLNKLNSRHWDVVVDTSGYVPSVVRASIQLLSESVEHYTFVSSQSVYANFDISGIDESYPVQELTDDQVREAELIEPGDGITAVRYGAMYGGLKAKCEQAVVDEMPGRSLCIRSGLIVGPNDYSDRFTYWVRRIAEGGEVLAPGDGKSPVQFVDVRDLSDWIVRMAESGRTGTFNATGPDRKMTIQELFEALRDVTNNDANFAWVNEQFLKDRKIAGWTELPLWLPSEDNIVNFFSLACDKAIGCGLIFRPLMETARDTLKWDRSRSTGLQAGLSRDRETELLRAWHDIQ